ncbi:hypothetical protein C9374_006928 [Naegleria lovaniensis]|uniref:Uncharacterized protein n=1 Tax=Naegleria lovaniensis TaxID=51637 RepID=A0AA88KRN3_NAELO|nr:uncharacterized protein C9374_006928 [Naegleria lovaniensis]KAG2393397.1 hypothetical protein C9374_006928 [Naegleria lovaniensis]
MNGPISSRSDHSSKRDQLAHQALMNGQSFKREVAPSSAIINASPRLVVDPSFLSSSSIHTTHHQIVPKLISGGCSIKDDSSLFPNTKHSLQVPERKDNYSPLRTPSFSSTNSETSILIHDSSVQHHEYRFEDGVLPDQNSISHPSWPVYFYSDKGEIFMRVLCIKVSSKEIIVIDPFAKKTMLQGLFSNVAKISYDNSEVEDTHLKLFRVQFKKRDAMIFLSKDRNEIINCLLFYLREFRETELLEIINTGKNQLQQNAFTPDLTVGLHEFQVFGIDKRGRYFPHILGLYSNHIRHIDSETRDPFSIHSYMDIVENDIFVDPEVPTKLTINYRDDNPYTFLVSDRDRSDVLVLLQGRSFIYRSCISSDNYFAENAESAENALIDKVESSSPCDFPQKIFQHIPITSSTNIMTSDPVIDQSGILLHAISHPKDPYSLTDYQREHVDQIHKGMRVYMHVPKKIAFRGKKTSTQPRIVKIRMDAFSGEVIIEWGKTNTKLKHKGAIEAIETGHTAIIETSKISQLQLSNFSFALKVQSKEKSATVNGKLFLVASSSSEYQHFVQGIDLLLGMRKCFDPKHLI